jgi:hypothetical protein
MTRPQRALPFVAGPTTPPKREVQVFDIAAVKYPTTPPLCDRCHESKSRANLTLVDGALVCALCLYVEASYQLAHQKPREDADGA